VIHSLPNVLGDETYHSEEITVGCRITGGPKHGGRGGDKTLYDIETPAGGFDGEAFLSVWHEAPDWTQAFSTTAEYVQSAIEDVPLQQGEYVLARGVPNTHNGKWYFNVSTVLIRDPSTTIGKSEMRSASECPRIYNLAFEKNVYSPGRYDFSSGSIKGRLVHSLVEYAVKQPEYREKFETGWSEDAMEDCFEEVIDREYSIDLALCRLAWVSANRIKKQAWSAIEPLLTDNEFTETIADADSVTAEVSLSTSTGFNGQVDLLVDGVPYDLKTNYRLSDSQRKKHKFQLRIYLLALLLESLDSGETVAERVAEGVEGVLVYPNLKDADDVVFDQVRLREHDIADIMEMRNEAAVLRDGFGVPTTYGRDCAGCKFKEPTPIGAGTGEEGRLPPPCQYHCQSERRWECFETNDSGEIITQCPLFDECEQRLDFRDPSVTDHYNQLRTALNQERDARSTIGRELDRLDEGTLVRAGLKVPDLSLESLKGQVRLVFTAENVVIPSFTPGTQVRLTHEATDYSQTATYYGHADDTYVFELDGRPTPPFLDPTATFEATRTLSTDTFPRELLSQLDYAQRAEVSPVLEATGPAADAVDQLNPDQIAKIGKYFDNKEVYIDLPVRRDREAVLAELVETLATEHYPVPGGEDEIDGTEQRVLILTDTSQRMDHLTDKFGNTDGVVRMDGFSGNETATITPTTPSHEIYTALRDADVLVSSMRYALADHVFHAMQSGDESTRPHSDRFFDSVVLVGAEILTEPQFLFLRVLGDRVVAVGDTRRYKPKMVSGEAQKSRLNEPYFNRLYRQFANIQSPNSQCLSIPAELTPPMQNALQNLDIQYNEIEGTFEFMNVSGSTSSALTESTISKTVPCQDSEEARFLRLEPVDDIDALQISRQLDQLRTLDAGKLTIRNTYTIQDIQFAVRTNNPINGDQHKIEVNTPLHATPFLHQRLTYNDGEAEAVIQACETYRPDLVVTPFAAQANTLRHLFDKEDMDVPVRLSSETTGDMVETAIISLAASKETQVVSSPVSDIETLYSTLTCAQNVILVGDRSTLERNTLLGKLVV